MTLQIPASVSTLRATATSFIPGAIKHVIKKVQWHPQGITSCMMFEVVPNEATIRGRKSSFTKGLHKTHGTENPNNPRNSKIRDANPEEAVPFKIPSTSHDIPVAEPLEEGADTSNMVQCTVLKLEPECPLEPPNLVRQKSYSKLNISDACLSLTHMGLNHFNKWSTNEYRDWINKSEPMTPGVRQKPPCELAHLGRINTSKGVPVELNTDTNKPHTQRYNYCDN